MPPGSRRAVGHRWRVMSALAATSLRRDHLNRPSGSYPEDSSNQNSGRFVLQASQGAGMWRGPGLRGRALNSPKRALESQISMSHLVPLLEFNHFWGPFPSPRAFAAGRALCHKLVGALQKVFDKSLSLDSNLGRLQQRPQPIEDLQTIASNPEG